MIPDSLSAIANHLWQSTLFAIAAGLLTLTLRKNAARVRHWVWVTASLKFLVPFAVFVALGSRVQLRTATVPTETNFAVALDQVSQPFTASVSSAPLSNTVLARTAFLHTIIWLVWACGFIGKAFSWWIQWRRMKATVRAGSPVQLGLPIRTISSASFVEPGVFGVFRPVLLVPEGIFDHLTPDQWKSVVAHELCHIRHRDNLIAIIHLFIESVFWFHPLVRWIGKRILQERERACDEEVLRLGNQPRAYAQGILKVCELYLESPLECVAGVSGSNLRRRIERIMNYRLAVRVNVVKKTAMAAAGIVCLALPIAIGTITASTPWIASAQDQAAFEVVSVKVHRGGGGTTREIGRDGLRYINITLGEFINMAYGGKRYQLAGPDWAVNNTSSDRYDIVAKAAEALPPNQIGEMIGPVLADRFKLAFHREKRELPVFALTVAKGGPKFKMGDGGESSAYPDGTGAVSFKNYTMDALANLLSNMPAVGRAVVDHTGLEGRYTFTANLLNSPAGLTLGEQKKAEFEVDPLSTPIFTTLQEQLGLKLETQKASIDMIVIDHVDKVPAEN